MAAGFGMAGNPLGSPGPASGHRQRGFGEPVAGEKGFRIEAIGGKSAGKALEGFHLDPFGSGRRGIPAGKIESGEFFVADRTQAEVEGEIRAAAEISAVAADGAQPANRTLHEVVGGKEGQGNPRFERKQDFQHQTHVVVGWQPAQTGTDAQPAQSAAERRQMVTQVPVMKHHALRIGGGAGRILQQARPVAFPGRPLEGFAAGRESGGIEQGDSRQRSDGCFAKNQLGSRVAQDRLQTLPVAAAPRWIGGHRDGAGIPAGEETGDEAQAGRFNQQDRLADGTGAHEPAGHGPRVGDQFPITQEFLGLLAVGKKAIGQAPRVVAGTLFEYGGQGPAGRMGDGFGGGGGGNHREEIRGCRLSRWRNLTEPRFLNNSRDLTRSRRFPTPFDFNDRIANFPR